MTSAATSTGTGGVARMRNTASATTSIMSPGEMAAQARLPVIAAQRLYMAAVKKMMPAYITATKRRLFESDDNASIVHADSSACVSETSVIAGSRNRFWRQERGAARERHLQHQQQHRRQPT